MERRIMSADFTAGCYDGTSSFPVSDLPTQTGPRRAIQLSVTAVTLAGPQTEEDSTPR